jgi:hypothetical protein
MARTQGRIGLIAETLLSADSNARSSVQATSGVGLLEGTTIWSVDKHALYSLRPADTQTPDNDKVVAAVGGGNWVLEWGGADPTEVRTLGDLPAPTGGVITLPDGTTWLIVGHVDLDGNRLVMGQNSSLYGLGPNLGSGQACSCLSTANSATAVSLYNGATVSSVEGLCILNADGPALGWVGTGGYVRIFNCCVITDHDCQAALFRGDHTGLPDLDLMESKFMAPEVANSIAVEIGSEWSTLRLFGCTLCYADGLVLLTGGKANEVAINGCRFSIGNGFTGIVQTDADPGTILIGGSLVGNVFRGAGTPVNANVAAAVWAARGNIPVADF